MIHHEHIVDQNIGERNGAGGGNGGGGRNWGGGRNGGGGGTNGRDGWNGGGGGGRHISVIPTRINCNKLFNKYSSQSPISTLNLNPKKQ